jgi:beta-phosphoglucomutase family hydrolase
MSTRYSAFIFDMDGTLVDNMPFHTRAWMETLGELGANPDPRTFLDRTAGMVNPEIFRMFLGTRLTDEQIAVYAAQKEQRYRRFYTPHLRPLAGLPEFLLGARAAGMRLAVATAANSENATFVLDGIGLRSTFDVVVTADDITRGKPDPQIFLITAQRLGVAAERCLVFEDAPMGIEAARRAGMSSVALTTSITAQKAESLAGVRLAAGDFRTLNPLFLAT